MIFAPTTYYCCFYFGVTLWFICDQFVKLALAARPAGPTTPASSSLSPSSSSSPESEVLLGAPAPSATLGAAATVAVSLSQKNLPASLSTAISTYSNASTATTGNSTLPATSDPPVVLVPVEKGFMAREPEEWIPPESSKSKAREERALALEKDRLVRSRSVAKDTLLNLPVSVPMPDGEELYRGATSQLRNYDQHAEITKGYIQGPPNKTVWDSPDWRDWNPGVLKSCSCSPGSSQPRPKSSSTGQLSSWGLHWSRSGKSPPSHTRTRCHHHQRHSHPSNSKNSCSSSASSSSCKHKHLSTSSSSSTCSSTSSSTSSCAGLTSVVNSGSNGPNVTSGMLASIGGKIQSAFSDKVQSGGSSSAGDNAWTNTNYNTNPGVTSRTIDKTKLPSKTAKGYYSQNSKHGKSYSGISADTESLQSNASNSLLATYTEENITSSQGADASESGCSGPGCSFMMPRTKPASKSPLRAVVGTDGDPRVPGNSQVSLLPRMEGASGYQTLSTPCGNNSLCFSQNSHKGVCGTERQQQDLKCSVNDDNGNGRVQPLIREQCGDIQCRLEEVNNSDSKDLQHEQNKHIDRSRSLKKFSLMASRTVKADIKSNNSPNNRKTSPSNKDQLWKDMLQHERQLVKLWQWKWDFLLQPEFCTYSTASDRQDAIMRKDLCGTECPQSEHYFLNGPKPPSIPLKSSEWIGLMAKDGTNPFDMYLTKSSRPPKIRFQEEQYGKYRNLKYLMKAEPEQKAQQKVPQRIRHTVKPLLC
ncbi:unnamed protein product [Allacma fusca]|uniref:Uncharacterized protein n=1 Tax=Allacma fusca TaxID=39272 RepID=A0A8J2NR61_9HEXA|nr:unnamed protein product [Allacma fusca]